MKLAARHIIVCLAANYSQGCYLNKSLSVNELLIRLPANKNCKVAESRVCFQEVVTLHRQSDGGWRLWRSSGTVTIIHSYQPQKYKQR